MFNPYASLSSGTRRVLFVASLLGFLVFWSALSLSGTVPPAKLPPPWGVFDSIIDQVVGFGYRSVEDGTTLTAAQASMSNPASYEKYTTSPLLVALGYSGARIFAAALLAIAVGFPVGILMGASPSLNAFLGPVIDPFRSAPIVATMPIMMVWFGVDEAMKVAFLWLGAVVYLIPMVRDAIRAVPLEFIVSAQDEGATGWEVLRYTLIPLAMPRIADAVIVAVSVMWTYITVAEYTNANNGLGTIIQDGRRAGNMDLVFAGVILILVVALVTDVALRFARSKLYPWAEE